MAESSTAATDAPPSTPSITVTASNESSPSAWLHMAKGNHRACAVDGKLVIVRSQRPNSTATATFTDPNNGQLCPVVKTYGGDAPFTVEIWDTGGTYARQWEVEDGCSDGFKTR